MSQSLRESAAAVRSVDEFKRWTKLHLRPILAHESLLCGFGHIHAGGVGLDYVVAVDYPVEHLDAIRNRAGAIDTPILRRWLATRQPVVFDGANPWSETPAQWLDSFQRYDLRNIAAHAVLDAERCVGTYHSLYRMPSVPDAAYIATLCDVVPVLHEVLCRVVESALSKDRFASRIAQLNEREQEIVRWAGLGKTNPEIADIVGMSESTVKHYLTDVFDKLGISNRAQLVRCLTEHETKRASGQITKLL